MSIGVEMYDHDKHLGVVTTWLSARNLALPDRRLFSDFGIIVDGIAVGFLFKTNSGIAYLDHIAADPKVSESRRDRALTMLFDLLEDAACRAGFLVCYILCQLPAMRNRVRVRGYQRHGEYGLYFKPGEKICRG